MFKSVHHVQYAVKDLDEMMKYFEKNFDMIPDDAVEYEERRMRDAIYEIGETHIQMTETCDPNSGSHGLWLPLAEGVREVKPQA